MSDIKKWFKKQLRLIEIEVFSFCNRRCWFCPNSFIDRHSDNHVMSDEMYIKILSDLAEISYDQEITYSRYNEPLAYKNIILHRIREARNILPLCKLRTNTNGDYINLNYIEELRDNGLNELFIQQYLTNNELYNHNKIKEKMLQKIEKIGLEYRLITDIDNQRIEYELIISGMVVHLRARNFGVEGSARTQQVKQQSDVSYIRTHPCKQPYNNMYIDYNGNVMVCCNTRSDILEHQNGIMGNIKNQNLWNIYNDSKYNIWRENLKNYSPKTGICKDCKIDIPYQEFIK